MHEKAVLWIRNGFKEDPVPAFYLNADPNPGRQTNADPNQTTKYQKLNFYMKI